MFELSVMRRSGESSQYHDETPRRRVRRPQSQDLEGLHINEMKGRAQEMAENSPTSPFKAGPFVLPQSPGSMQNPVSPHRLYSQHNPRSQSTGIPPSPHGYPHSAISPSRYPPGPPIYMSVPSPSSGISTPSCATPSSTTSIPSPDFFGPGMAEGTIPMSPSKSDPSYPIRSPSYYQPDHKPIYPESPQFNYPQGPSPGGTIHHLGYNRPVHGQTGFPSHPPPNTITPRMTSPSSTANLHPSQSPVYRTPQGVNPEHLPGNPSGRKFTNQPPLGKPPDSPETARLRQLVIEYYNNERENLKTKYYEKLQELFFLQNGGNLMDILIWKRRPNPQFTSFINSNKLEDGLVNLNVTPTSNPSSGGGGMWQQQKTVLEGNPEFTNVQRPGNEQAGPSLPANSNPSFYHEGFAPNVSPFTGNNMGQNIPALSRSLSMPNPSGMNVNSATSGNHINHQTGHKTNSVAHTNNTGSNPVINRSISVGGQPVANGPSNPSNTSVRTTSVNKNASVLSVLDNSFGSHEEIAVEAKKEAEVLKRVAELRKEGLWSTRRLPKVQEMSRKKAHWDYLLEEMQWLATDFAQERRWKRGVAKKVS